MVHFESGFVPFGVFCAQIAHLIAHQEIFVPSWELCEEIYKNKFSFIIDKAYCATLISRPKYLEINLHCADNADTELSLASVCDHVRTAVIDTLELVISSSKVKLAQSFKLAFQCSCSSHSDHLMVVHNQDFQTQLPTNAECLMKHIRYKLEHHIIWFGKVYAVSYTHLTLPTIYSV